jgi:hypothetical protein
MIRSGFGSRRYWDKWTEFDFARIAEIGAILEKPSGNPSYRPQYVYELAKQYWELSLRRYSRGDSQSEIARHFGPGLDAWEEAERLGRDVWTPEQQYTRHAWQVNFDHYIVCFWLIGLALALEVPDEQWNRLIALVGNDGEDALLDRIIATPTPARKIGSSLCFKKPYCRLLAAIDAPAGQQPELLRDFVIHWYEEIGAIGRHGRAKQAVSYAHPYWYRFGDQNFEGGAYFGRWCVEAVAAVKAFGMDDSLCLGHEHHPGDLLRPGGT